MSLLMVHQRANRAKKKQHVKGHRRSVSSLLPSRDLPGVIEGQGVQGFPILLQYITSGLSFLSFLQVFWRIKGFFIFGNSQPIGRSSSEVIAAIHWNQGVESRCCIAVCDRAVHHRSQVLVAGYSFMWVM